MLDMKFVRENLDAVRTMLKNRCNALDLSSFTELDERRRAILQDVEEKRSACARKRARVRMQRSRRCVRLAMRSRRSMRICAMWS